MIDSQRQFSKILEDVTQNLSSIFRHMLPGVLVLGAARLAYPAWFAIIDSESWQHLLMLAVVTVAVGNGWFALNRYGIYQITDYLLYKLENKPISGNGRSTYVNDLGQFTYRSLHTSEDSARARQHIMFRASSILLMMTMGEIAVIFGAWHASESIFVGYRCQIIIGGIVVLILGVWQEVIARRIDYYIVYPPSGSD